MKEGQGTEQWCSLLPWKGCAEWGVPAWEWDGTGAGTAAASPPRVPGAEQSLHECMTEKRADTQGYVEGKGRDSQGAGQERGAEMCSLAVAEDIYPTVTPAPQAWKREFGADLRA